ncbi:hypothetical protein HW532_15000 [Kaustia mangrovi]|uniref:Uncharacterized protein n=1 Tax=Kaustia mangrovi TaxID=2593653 RepID=A0A7S8C5P3_9HYPH|nr:hypothetical protein [Kaustia mangrovi]QPC43880.1 hypothetical protein HW532_15000 [Kaustia mangrovi]
MATVLNLFRRADGIQPTGVHAYFDKVTVWLKRPVNDSERTWLEGQCGSGGLHVQEGPAHFNPALVQRLQLRQPTREALEWLAKRNDVHLNLVEWGLDWVFNNEGDRDEAWAFLCRYHVKSHHRQQGVRFVAGNTRYTGPRRAPQVFVCYRDLPCRVTGELYCVHLEWRIKGAQTLRRLDLDSIDRVLRKGHRGFWLNQLTFYELVHDDLGRRYHNWALRHRQHRPIYRPCIAEWPNGFRYYLDRRAGGTLARALGSTQAVVDEYGSRFNIRRSLFSIDIGRLLPE